MTQWEKVIKGIKGLMLKPAYYVARVAELELEREFKNYVSTRYRMPNGLPTIDILDIFPDFHETIEPLSGLPNTSLPIEIAFLKAIAKKIQAQSYFEIGTLRGESITTLSDIIPKCISLSLSDDELRAMGFPQSHIDHQRLFSKHRKNIQHIGHNSRTFDFSPFYKSIDLCFIDGDHSYRGIFSDTKNCFQLLRDEKSIIIWDDYGHEHIRWQTLAAILDALPESEHKFLYRVSNTNASIYLRESVKSYDLPLITLPNKTFKMEISATPFRA